MNMFKKNGGFTLVELIVVIAILAILAAVAVPAYSGYITKANDAADTTALASVKTAAQAAWATKGAITQISVEADNGVVTAVKVNPITTETKGENGAASTFETNWTTLYTYDDTKGAKWEDSDFKMYMNEDMIELKGSFKIGAVWADADGVVKIAHSNGKSQLDVKVESGWNIAHECEDSTSDDDDCCDVCGGEVSSTNG